MNPNASLSGTFESRPRGVPVACHWGLVSALSLTTLLTLSCGGADRESSTSAERCALFRQYLPPGLEPGAAKEIRARVADEQGGLNEEKDALLQRVREWKGEKATSARALFERAQQYARDWGAEPVPFLACFSDKATRGRLACYWVVAAAFVDIEREVDRLCGRGAWREISDDYACESVLVSSTLPDVVPLVSTLRELVWCGSSKQAATFDSPYGGVFDPTNGRRVLAVVDSNPPAPPPEIATDTSALTISRILSEKKPDIRPDLGLCFSDEHVNACGVSFQLSDDYMPNAVPIAVVGARGWRWSALWAIDLIRQSIQSAAQDPDSARERIGAVVRQLVSDSRTSAVVRLPMNTRMTLRLSAVLDNTTGGRWATGSESAPWNSPSWSTSNAGPSIPILTPTGVNPVLLGGQANPWSFGR